jgi:competence protein ComGC
MKKLFILWLLFLPNLANAQTTINNLGAAGALAGTEAGPDFSNC